MGEKHGFQHAHTYVLANNLSWPKHCCLLCHNKLFFLGTTKGISACKVGFRKNLRKMNICINLFWADGIL